jgi:hypothetical protein
MYVDKLDGRVDGAFFDKMSAAEHSSSISSFEFVNGARVLVVVAAGDAQIAALVVTVATKADQIATFSSGC